MGRRTGRPRGRPTTLTDELIDRLHSDARDGLTDAEIIRIRGIPSSTFYKWKEQAAQSVLKNRRSRARLLVEELARGRALRIKDLRARLDRMGEPMRVEFEQSTRTAFLDDAGLPLPYSDRGKATSVAVLRSGWKEIPPNYRYLQTEHDRLQRQADEGGGDDMVTPLQITFTDELPDGDPAKPQNLLPAPEEPANEAETSNVEDQSTEALRPECQKPPG